MEKRFYKTRTFLLKPIDTPKKIDLFKHIILFINETDMTIERAIPDFEERHIDSKSSNVVNINEDTFLSYFEIIDYKSKFLPSNEPVFEVKLYEGEIGNKTKYIGPKIVASRCINFYSITIEDVILDGNDKVKIKML